MKPTLMSPDLNCIENLWDILDQNVRQHQISIKKLPYSCIKEEWIKLTPRTTLQFLESTVKRLIGFIDQKGSRTKL